MTRFKKFALTAIITLLTLPVQSGAYACLFGHAQFFVKEQSTQQDLQDFVAFLEKEYKQEFKVEENNKSSDSYYVKYHNEDLCPMNVSIVNSPADGLFILVFNSKDMAYCLNQMNEITKEYQKLIDEKESDNIGDC